MVRNLTPGFDQSRGFEYIIQPGGRWNSVPWMSWSPAGDRLAFFVRTEKDRSLVVEDVAHPPHRAARRAERRRRAGVARLLARRQEGGVLGHARRRHRHLRARPRQPEAVTNVTNDGFADYAPDLDAGWQRSIVTTRVSGNEKLFRVEVAGGKRTQLTFGTHDDGGAQFLDDNTLVFSSTAVDPNETIDPEVGQERRHLQHLDARI